MRALAPEVLLSFRSLIEHLYLFYTFRVIPARHSHKNAAFRCFRSAEHLIC
jgi:hypothetical protein